MRSDLLRISDLSVAISTTGDRHHAVEDVSLTVAPGEVVCIVGESGSGKSVMAQAVLGLLPAGQLKVEKGAIRLQGEDLVGCSPRRLRELRGARMGVVFQEPSAALNPVERIGSQIMEILNIHERATPSAMRKRILDMLEAVHLPDPPRIMKAYPHELSGGQLQRVMIAMALILDPGLLIADEPTTALDVTTQSHILELIKDLQTRRGTGVLFITHDFGVVADIADRVIVMQRGRIVEEGPTRKVLAEPEHPYTRMLINAVPNMVPPQRKPCDGPVAISAKSVSKRYVTRAPLLKEASTFTALDRVSIEIRRGETLGVVGESGSGKSTLARCIARLSEPSGGVIEIGGTDVSRLSERRLRPYRKTMQLIFQDPYRSLNPRRSVGDSIIEGPMNFGMSKAEAMMQAGELMQLVGLEKTALGRLPHQFSGGQRQRICIARALAMKPEVLIADESVSALDVSVQRQVLALIEDVRQRFNLAILFITHDLRIAAQICDRIAVMFKGEVVEQGATAEVFSRPAHEYTRILLATAPGKMFPYGP